MRFLYLLLYFTLPYSLRLYYPKQRVVNKPRKHFGRTIYVSNHAASFMDPLIVGSLQRPIVFFMTRSDVFTKAMKPILWMAHMLPIYRQHDGEDTKAKNDETFKKCTQILKGKRNLLIFGEGFTDDVFIRRLKPVKKGAARIGFGSLEAMNWEKEVFIAAIGINYSDPNYLGGSVLVSNGEPICLNDYKAEYLENPSKAVNEVTKRIELDLQAQITHVEDADWVFFHEHVSRLQRNGMHPEDPIRNISLLQKWKNSKALAAWMNAQNLNENQELITLKNELDAFFKKTKKQKIKDSYLRKIEEKESNLLPWISLILLFPLMLLGAIHCYLPYKLIKNFTEKSFKRAVFWSSVKMMLGAVAIGLFNIPLVLLLNHFVFIPLFFDLKTINLFIPWIYYFTIPIFGVIAYRWFQTAQDLTAMARLRKSSNLASLLEERRALIEKTGDIRPETKD
jgi:1-acyl-sn-glycerol-3-phosphate acyltransferase